MTKKYGMLLVGLVFFSLVGLVFFSYVFSNPFTPAGHEGFVYENPRVFGKGGFEEQLKDREIMGLLYGEIRLSISI